LFLNSNRMVVDRELLIMGVQLEDILSVVFTNRDAWHNLVGTGVHSVS
jgi:hypothetical protein